MAKFKAHSSAEIAQAFEQRAWVTEIDLALKRKWA